MLLGPTLFKETALRLNIVEVHYPSVKPFHYSLSSKTPSLDIRPEGPIPIVNRSVYTLMKILSRANRRFLAGFPEAQLAIQESMEEFSELRVTLPVAADSDLISHAVESTFQES